MSVWPHAAFSQRATWPPSATVRQRERARMVRSGGERRRVEAVDELVEDGFEAGIVVVRVGSNDVDDFAVAVGRLSMISSGLVDHAEAIPAVVHVGEAFEEVASGALGAFDRLPG